jgi:hypothetical protein
VPRLESQTVFLDGSTDGPFGETPDYAGAGSGAGTLSLTRRGGRGIALSIVTLSPFEMSIGGARNTVSFANTALDRLSARMIVVEFIIALRSSFHNQ